MNNNIEVQCTVANNTIHAIEPKKQQLVPQVVICFQQRKRRYLQSVLHQLQPKYKWRFRVVILAKFIPDQLF